MREPFGSSQWNSQNTHYSNFAPTLFYLRQSLCDRENKLTDTNPYLVITLIGLFFFCLDLDVYAVWYNYYLKDT